MAHASAAFEADLANLSKIRSFIEKTARDAEIPEEGVSGIRLAVDEACANIIQHGYAGNSGEIRISAESNPAGLVVTLADDAPSFDPLVGAAAPDLEASLDDRPIGGMGVLLVKQNTDAVEYQTGEQGGNVLILTKSRRSPEGG